MALIVLFKVWSTGPGSLLDEGLKQEAEFSRKVLSTEDAREGPLAFAQKRKPDYKGR